MSDLVSLLGRRLAAIAASVPRVVSATVVSDLVPAAVTQVELDTGQGAWVSANGLGVSYAAGTRVTCLAYPPRGLLILGPLS